MRIKLHVGGITIALLFSLVINSAAVSDVLTLQQAIDIAIKVNPDIQAGQLSAQAAVQAARGAKALTNPELIVAPSVIGEAGSDAAVFFSQPLEINGTRRVRGKIAANEANAANFDAVTTRRDIMRDVKQTYWEVARTQELVHLNKENIQFIETLRDAVQKQFDVGTVPGSQVLKTDVELARARQEFAQAQLELNQVKASLNALMNRPPNIDFTVADPIAASVPPLDRDQLLAAAQANRPEVAAAQAELEAARGRIQAAKLQRVPDLAVQARRETFKSDSESGVAIALSLPILDWGSAKAERRRAQTAAQSQEKRLEAVRNSAALDVEQTIQQAQATSQIVQEYQGGILEKSEQLAQMARTGYEKGATSYLEVLEAQRTLRSTRTAYYSALANRAKALAQLEWATGCDIPNNEISEVKK